MPSARPNLKRAAKTGKSAAFCVAGALAGAGLYAANLAYLHNQAPATLIASLSVHGQLHSLALDPKSDILAAGVDGRRARTRLWNITDPARPVKVGQTPIRAGGVSQVAFTPDGTLATDEDDGVTLWDKPNKVNFDDGATLVNPHHPSHLKDHTLLISNDQTSRYGYDTGSVTLWNAAHPAHPVTLHQPPATRTKGELPSAAFTPDGKTLAFATGDGKVTLRNTNNPAHPLSQPHAINTKGGWVSSMAFFPSGKTLVTGSINDTVRLWNVTNPARPVKLSQPITGSGTITARNHHGYWVYSPTIANTVNFVAVSPNSKILAIGQKDDTIALWNVTNPARSVKVGQPIKANENLNSVAFTPDSKALITGTFGNPNAKSRVKIWRLNLSV